MDDDFGWFVVGGAAASAAARCCKAGGEGGWIGVSGVVVRKKRVWLRRTGWVAVVGGAEDGVLVFGHVEIVRGS